MLGFENLHVYRRSIEFLAHAFRIAASAQGELASQRKRAALSVPLNIAEGTGRTGRADFRRGHRAVARGSAMECGALLDACRILGVAGEAALREARVLLERVVRVLTKMCR